MDETTKNAAQSPAAEAHPAQPGTSPATADTAEESLQAKAYQRQERLVTGLLVVAIGVALVFAGWYVREHSTTLIPTSLQPLARRVGMMKRLPEQAIVVAHAVGLPTAKVKVVVIMEHCLIPVQDFFVAMGNAYPEQVQAEFLPMYNPDAQKVLAEHKDTCAGVYINGSNRVTITVDGAEKEIALHGNPGMDYPIASLVTALKRDIVAAYGSAPADFDERAKAALPPPPPGGYPVRGMGKPGMAGAGMGGPGAAGSEAGAPAQPAPAPAADAGK